MELEKIQVYSTKELSDLKAEIKYIESQWEKSAFRIKDNILAQALVICPTVDFNQVELHCHVADGRIKDVPEDEDDEANLESDPSNSKAAP